MLEHISALDHTTIENKPKVISEVFKTEFLKRTKEIEIRKTTVDNNTTSNMMLAIMVITTGVAIMMIILMGMKTI
jgi:hypothetical protein